MNGGLGSRVGILFGLCGVLALTGALLLRGRGAPLVGGTATATASPLVVAAPSSTSAIPALDTAAAPIPTAQAEPSSVPTAQSAPASTPTAQSGSSSDPAHIVTIEDTLTFDAQDPGSSSSAQTVHLSNEGGTDQPLGKATLGGDNPDVFALGVDTCLDTLSAASGCTVDVTFTPSKEGEYAATLTFPDAQGNTLATVALKGTGQASTPDISADSGSVALDQTTTSGSVSVSNNGKFDANLSISLQGANSDYFSQSNDCDTVSGGGSCSISVTFQPPGDASGGIYYATIDINNAADGSTLTTVDLNGTVADASNIVRRSTICARRCAPSHTRSR